MKERWKARCYDGGWSVVMARGTDYEIAAINGRRENPEAIARLLSASPELRDALIGMMQCHHDAGVVCVHWKRAEKAVTKATGEKP